MKHKNQMILENLVKWLIKILVIKKMLKEIYKMLLQNIIKHKFIYNGMNKKELKMIKKFLN